MNENACSKHNTRSHFSFSNSDMTGDTMSRVWWQSVTLSIWLGKKRTSGAAEWGWGVEAVSDIEIVPSLSVISTTVSLLSNELPQVTS